MSKDEKIALIEECMDIEEGSLKLDKEISDYDEWDSLTALSIIAAVSEKTGQTITGDDIKKVKTVSDILKLIQ